MSPRAARNAAGLPDILLITCHDLGRHLGCYGVASVHSPGIDRLASSGVLCGSAFCSAPQCSPSRATLATGRYPHSNGVMGLTHGSFGWDLKAGERHAAAHLGAAGYRTHLFGLQHVTRDVRRLGFDHVHGDGPGREVAAAVAGLLSRQGLAGPLYVEVNLFEPHRPYDFGGVRPDDSKGVFVPAYLPDGEPARREMAALQGAVRATDANVGRMLAALDVSDRAENTLVVFTADHGIAMPRAKCTLYDPGIEVALIARWPRGGVAGRRVVSDLIGNVDVLPTLLDAAGLPSPPELQGHSLLPVLQGGHHTVRDAIYAEKTWHSYYDPMRAIRTRRHKLIRNFEPAFAVEVPGDVQRGALFRSAPERYSTDRAAGVELYDLEEDPLERRNQSGETDIEEVERDLDARLWRWMEETSDPLLEGPVPSPSLSAALASRELPSEL